jgi:hypothetical protein
MTADEQPLDRAPDPRESAYVLPPLEGRPFADDHEKVQAVLRVIEQAERERSAPD